MFGEEQWSTEGGNTTWKDSIKYILPAISNDDLAENGFDLKDHVTGVAPPGAQMSSMIAYSAINEGTTIYGDTGIRALFNDADDLGKALQYGSSLFPNSINEDVLNSLGKVVAEYAAFLAYNQVLQTDNANAVNGIITLSSDIPNSSSMEIDLRHSTWTFDSIVHEIYSKNELVDNLIKSAISADDLIELKNWYATSADNGGTGDLIDDIDEIVASLQPATIYAPLDAAGVAIQIGSNLKDNYQFTNGSDLVLGGKGDDILWGNGGADILLGGADNDTLVGGSGNDWLDGGDGYDTVHYTTNSANQTIHFKFDGTLPKPVIKVDDGMGGEDTLRSIEKVVGTTGNDIFSFKGSIPTGYNLLIDGGGGGHDIIDLHDAVDPKGMKLYITNKSAGEGFIQSRSGGAYGTIRLQNFHTNIIGSDASDLITDDSSGVHTIDGGAGDDKITVSGSGATIDGGAGNDVIHLKTAAATIKFGVGGGHDVVEFDSGDGDYSLALQNLNPDDVEVIAGGHKIYGQGWSNDGNPYHDGFHAQFIAVRIKATGETITFLENGDNVGPGGLTYDAVEGARKLDSITFADGTVIGLDELQLISAPEGFITGVDSHFDGWSYSRDYPNYLVFGPNLRPASEYLDYVNSTYLQAAPIGAPPPAPDRNIPGSPDDDDLQPGDGNDDVTPGTGSDTVHESRGNDTYHWNSGDGDDTITGSDATDGFNTLALGSGITPADLQFAVANDGAGLTISFASQAGSITMTDELVGDGYAVDRLVFSDGTIMSRADLLAAAATVISAAETTVDGTTSDDYLFAPRGNFIVNGLAGDDYIIVGGSGSGIIRFASTDGHDEVDDWGLGYSRNDTLELTDVNPGGVTLTRSGEALLVTINSTGASMNLTKQFVQDDGNVHGVSRIVFADGTIWKREQIIGILATAAGDSAPTATAATASTVQDAAIVRGALVATDPDAGDTLTFSLDAPITGLAVAADGSWSFDPSNPAYQHLAQGEQLTLTANYHVTDSYGASSSSTLTLTVTGTEDMPLVQQELSNRRLVGTDEFLLDVTSNFVDPDGDTLAFTATLADGTALPSWLAFDNGQFSGVAPAGTSGVLDIVVAASDGILDAHATFRLHFGPDNLAPTAQAISDASGNINTALDVALPEGTFVDPEGDALTLTATLGDGSALPAWLSFANGHLTGTPPSDAAGTYEIKVTATDGELSTSSSFSLSIANYQLITGTTGDDYFDLTTGFVVNGGLGDDFYSVTGDGSGAFNFAKGDGHDELDQPGDAIRNDTLVLTDINSDDVSVARYDYSATFTVDDTGDTFTADWQFSGEYGGVPLGVEEIQFADGVTWNRNEILNRSATNEIAVDAANPDHTGTSLFETFVIGSGFGESVIDDFAAVGADHDYLQFDRSQFSDWAHLLGATVQQGSDLVINLDENDSVRLTGVSMSNFTSLDVRFVGAPV